MLFVILFGYAPIALGLLIAVVTLARRSSARRCVEDKKRMDDHYELSYKLSNKGSNTSSYAVAKDCYDRMQESYAGIQSSVSGVSRHCYEEDIADVHGNMEALIEDRWDKKARLYLNTISELYWLIMDCDFASVDEAYKSKNKLLSVYDKYWEWTSKCHDELDHWGNINLWDEAKSNMKFALDDSGIVFWDNSNFGRCSVRQQLVKQVESKIETMRPEYKRKMKLYKLLVDYVYEHPDIARSKLLKISFDGFTSQEIAACYNSLVSKKRLIAVKIGSRYFVSLTDNELHKRECGKTEASNLQTL